jgi:Golgi SNAP receptor complex protein 2
MERLYIHTNQIVWEAQQCLEKLENAGHANSDANEREIEARIDSITNNCEKLEILIHKEPLNRRTNVKLRIDQLKHNRMHLQAALDTYRYRKYERLREERKGEVLLNLQFQPNSSQETIILMDHDKKHHTSLYNADRGVDDLQQSGARILESLPDQREILKGAHRCLYDVANTLGFSNTTMRLIERRAYQNKRILFGGMVFTLIVIVLTVFYVTADNAL